MSNADTVVALLRSFVSKGEYGLSEVPGLVKMVIQDDYWRDRIIQETGEVARFQRFEEFVHAKPLQGLGADMDLLRSLCGKDMEALEAIDRVTTGRQGERTDLVNNVNEVGDSRPEGNSRQQAIRRLRKDRPDLLARVLADELSPNAGMVEAGFRPRTFTVVEDVESAARTLRKCFTREQLDALIALLEAE